MKRSLVLLLAMIGAFCSASAYNKTVCAADKHPFGLDDYSSLRSARPVAIAPDGKQVLYSSSAGGCCRIFAANPDGSGFKPITHSPYIDTEPKVNPKTGSDVVFVSGRSGPQQIYHMNIDGGDIERLSEGTGEASNPSWHPDGQLIAFSWTRGFATGKFNVFTMDVASRRYIQLTHDEGKNENPSWAPDGAHLAFASTRTGRTARAGARSLPSRSRPGRP